MSHTLGDEIRRLRLAAKVTLRTFADQVGVSAAHMSDIEHDRRHPSPDLLDRVVKRLQSVGASFEKLQKLDTRIDAETKAWMSKNPSAGALLREIRKSGRDPLKWIEDLQRQNKSKGKS